MKILTVCEGGNVRSVGLAQRLKAHDHNAVAVGTMYAFASYNDRQPGTMLAEWADLVVVMSAEMLPNCGIEKNYHHKLKICEVGKDVYGNPFHHDLQKLCGEWMEKEGLGK